MKVVIVLCVKSFQDDLNKIFKESDITAYSEVDVKGISRKPCDTCEELNWFAPSQNYYESIAVFAFVEEDKGNVLLENVDKFNETVECCSPVHAFMLGVDKFV